MLPRNNQPNLYRRVYLLESQVFEVINSQKINVNYQVNAYTQKNINIITFSSRKILDMKKTFLLLTSVTYTVVESECAPGIYPTNQSLCVYQIPKMVELFSLWKLIWKLSISLKILWVASGCIMATKFHPFQIILPNYSKKTRRKWVFQ